jgi:hypothetical protein
VAVGKGKAGGCERRDASVIDAEKEQPFLSLMDGRQAGFSSAEEQCRDSLATAAPGGGQVQTTVGLR